ncbi:MAG: thiamine ABC transporter substrate-binding protein [Proteobacteria bacterium]|nr:thiamine ABC transporter substrate-binding protein [Pseudomonadota bacterium]
MTSDIASELEKCQVLLEELQSKTQQKHLSLWSELNPELKTWNEMALGYLNSFDLVEKYRNAKEGSPEAFLYSNSLESCVEFAGKYSMEIKKQELTELTVLIFLFGLIFGFARWTIRKKKKSILSMLALFFLLSAAQGLADDQPTLRIYTYDALTGKNSFGEFLSKKFSEKYRAKVQFISFGTAGEAVNQVILEGSKTKADLLMGLDEVLFRKVEKRSLFYELDPALSAGLEPDLKRSTTRTFIPFDYGFLSFVYDDTRTAFPRRVSLKTFPEALSPQHKVVVQDPRTSSLGIEFLIWTFEKLKDGGKQFWAALSPHILTVSPGWSGAYELFLRKQADFVISYTTSPAYHRIREKKESIKPLIFEEGHFRQVEGISVLKTSNQKELASKFIQYVVGEEAQSQLPTFQWIYPARKGIVLPSEFQDIPRPKQIAIDWEEVSLKKDQWIKDWALTLSQEPK